MMKKAKTGKLQVICFSSLVILVLMSFSCVSAFNVTVPNETINRYYQTPGLHQYATLTSKFLEDVPENVTFFNAGYAYPEPFKTMNRSWSYSQFTYTWDAGTFPVIIEGRPNWKYHVGWVLCEEGLTGKVCDRPPYMLPAPQTYPVVQFDLPNQTFPDETLIGKQIIYPERDCCMKNGMTYWEAVPNGQVYPSKGNWDVPFNGTRYYGEVTTDGNGVAIVMFDMDQTIREGKYKLHVQETNYNPGTDGKYEHLNAYIDIQKGPIQGPADASMPYADKSVLIQGLNYDSKYTYVWITGQNLPKCGVNLLDANDYNPTVINVSKDAKWEFSWDPTALNIGPGSYDIYYSSVDPMDPNQWACNDISCTQPNGICSLKDEKCQICGVFKKYKLSLQFPVSTASIDPVEVERCCCPGYPCGQIGGNEEIWLRGYSEGDWAGSIMNKTLQIWIFGEGMVGDKPFLFKEIQYLCNGKFDYELNKGILKENGVAVCDLAPGKYYVIVQSQMYNEKFDVTLQDSPSYTRDVQNGAVPVKEVAQTYVVSADPVRWSKEFVISGIDAKKGSAAAKALMEAIDNPGVDDQYATLEGSTDLPYFIIKDNACTMSVDFNATPLEGYDPLQVNFEGRATYNVSEWRWDFDNDGVVDSTEENPTHLYEKPGIYSVRLSAVDAKTQEERENIKYSLITVKSLKADFSYAPAKPDTHVDVQFRDKSAGKPSSWMWEFGDGSISTLQSPLHRYATPAVYVVNLTVSDEIGSSTTASQNLLVVHDPPVADFSAEPTKSSFFPATVACTDLSTGVVTAWKWEFVRGGAVIATSTDKNPVITFTEPGIYDVRLTVSNDGGENTAVKAGYLIIGDGSIISLAPGYNHVSIPRMVTADLDTVSALFSEVDTAGIPFAIYGDDNGVTNWTNVSDDYKVRPLEMVRVYSTASIDVIPTYITGGSYSKNLAPGWSGNGIGIMAMQPTAANLILNGLGESWDKVLAFNAETQRWEPLIIRGVNDDQYLLPTIGYIIEMNGNGVLTGGDEIIPMGSDPALAGGEA